MNALMWRFTRDNIANTSETIDGLRNKYMFQIHPAEDGTYSGMRNEDFTNKTYLEGKAIFITVDSYIMDQIKCNNSSTLSEALIRVANGDHSEFDDIKRRLEYLDKQDIGNA